MNAQGMTDFVFRPAQSIQGFGGLNTIIVGVKVGTSAVFQLVMFLARHHLKIVGRVVRSIAVNVMNNFAFIKRTAKHLFGNQSMLMYTAMLWRIYNAIARAVYMSALVIPMFLAVQAANRSFGNGRISKLFQSGLTKSLITQIAVLTSSHVVGNAQVGGRDLHRTNKATKFTGNRIHGVFSYCNYTVNIGCFIT